MTTDLREIMRERVQQTQPARIDIDAAVRVGDRRRRTRSLVGAGAAAAVIATALLGVPLIGEDSPRGITPAGAFAHREASYAVGSSIHYGEQVLDVSPHIPHAYVQTDDGFVFTDADGVVRLAGESGVEEIGNGVAGGEYLRADDTGSQVAWIDSDGPTPELVVYDTAAAREVVRTSDGFRAGMGTWRDDGNPAYVFAVDDGSVYVRDVEGLARIDIATGARTLLADGVSGFDVADVASGLIAHQPLGKRDPDGHTRTDDPPMTMLLGSDYSPDGTPIPQDSNDLSPGARYVVTDYNDSEQIFEVASGTEVTPQVPAYPFIAVSAWSGDGTAFVIGLDREERADLLDCTITSGTCTVVAEDIGAVGAFQLPIGEHLDS
jgi:hypothetical protein